ncbi:MAG: outer membrane protein assembly factor BamE [Caulobacterales bacterium]
MLRKAAVLVVIAAAGLGAAACTPMSAYQGYQAIDQKPADVKVGVDTRSTVLSKLGSPTATSTFDKNIWFYMDQTRNQTSFYRPHIVKRDIVAVAFDPDTEQVTSVNTYNLQDGRVIAYNTRQTPTRGREISILEQILGSIGNGSPLNTLNQDQTPGSHPDDHP